MTITTDIAIFVVASFAALLAYLWKKNDETHKTLWSALDRRAPAESLRECDLRHTAALEQLRADHAERQRAMNEQFTIRIQELAARQDREIDALKDSISRVTDSVDHLRREVSQGNLTIMQQLTEVSTWLRTHQSSPP